MIRVRVYTNKTPEEITDRSLVSDDGALLYRIVVASFFLRDFVLRPARDIRLIGRPDVCVRRAR